jgi:hypothetical protein
MNGKQYPIPAALAADWRRIPAGARLSDAGGSTYLVPTRAVQRAFGPEQYAIDIEGGQAFEIGDLTYPLTLTLTGNHGIGGLALADAAQQVLARWESGDLAAAVRRLAGALHDANRA